MKVLSICPNPSDGTSWYRAALPLARMQQRYDDFQFVEYGRNDIGWNDMVNFDVMFLQRPHSLEHLSLASKAVMMGMKVWVDLDDLITQVPTHSIAYPAYNQKVVKQIVSFLQHLNPRHTLLTVSTAALRDEVLKINGELNVVVVPNALDDKIFFPLPNAASPLMVDFAWRGSETHQLDVFLHHDTIKTVSEDYIFEFIGHNPFWARGFKRVILSNPGGLLEYFKYISRRVWGAWVVMLEDNTFNMCKSNIMYLEGVFAGANIIAPAWPEWSRPGVYTYGEGGKYPTLFDAMLAFNLSDYNTRNLEFLKTAQDVDENFRLSEWCAMRYNLLNNLFNT